MRLTILYGSVLLSCLIITTVEADIKWKYTDDAFGNQNRKNAVNGEQKKQEKRNKNRAVKEFDNDSEEQFEQNKKSKGRLANQKINYDSSEEDIIPRKSKGKSEREQAPKKIIGRIEHGKVKVLRRKEDAPQYSEDEGEEDYKQKVCRKSKAGKKVDCNGNDDNMDEEGDSGESKPAKKIKYSIKFQHEKQKKKETNGDISIMRLHKNGRKGYGKVKDDDSSEEDDKPLKRFRFIDDDD